MTVLHLQQEQQTVKDALLTDATQQTFDPSTRLAYQRTYLAHERTQMAWVRTSLALISFGFTIAEFLQYVRQRQNDQAQLLGPRTVGLFMIAVGVCALVVADLQHRPCLRALPSCRPRAIADNSQPPF
jgi:putative membrane protein